MDNYIVINGKKAELTQEQLEKLGIAVEKDAFERVKKQRRYYYITPYGRVFRELETNAGFDTDNYNVANYCTDKELMEQRALHETLNRLLWRYSMQNGGREIDWGNERQIKWSILYCHNGKTYTSNFNNVAQHCGAVYFIDETTAENAIEEIVKPFMEQHPEFRW